MPRRPNRRNPLAPHWVRLVFLVVTLNGGGDRNQLWRQVQPQQQPPSWWDTPLSLPGIVVRRGELLGAKYRSTLQRYVDTWLAAGRNFDQWIKQNESLSKLLRRTVGTAVLTFRADPAGGARLVPILLNTGWVKRNPNLALASWEFADFSQNPLREKVGKCPRCGVYFLNTSGHVDKKYCTQRCASFATAVESTRRRRQREHNEKLKKVRSVLRNLVPGDRETIPWKQNVAQRANVTTRWITRAVNRDELRLPAFLNRR